MIVSPKIATAKYESRRPCRVCASCHHQRIKCTSHCPMRPFSPPFPKTYDLYNVHCVFGIHNIIKLLRRYQRFEDEAAIINNIKFQALCKIKPPCLWLLPVCPHA
ncbi:hypothetical protein AMTRI_Chr01g129650 [Amborella trichopoda]